MDKIDRVLQIDADLDINEEIIEFDDDTNDENIEMELGDGIIIGGTSDYRKLKNKPTINGTELYDNYNEIDPTVPGWAKEKNKPTYTAYEVGAVDADDEMSFTQIKNIWDYAFRTVQ